MVLLAAPLLTAAGLPVAGRPPVAGPGHDLHPGAVLLAHGGRTEAQVGGTVKAVDAGRRVVTLSHGPVKAFGWPAMISDLPVAPDVDLAAFQPGAQVSATLSRGGKGTVEVEAMRPAP